MRILHTADLHLKGKEHVHIVETIIQVAEREEVDLIIIAGDLFDLSYKGRDLENLLLPIWNQFSGEILIVPGNHDFKYLNNRSQLANNVIVANQQPFSIAEIDHIYFVCVPYQPNISLSDIPIPHCGDPTILISHGAYGKSDDKYFPIMPNDIAGRYNYVALGHYHTWFDRWEQGTLVVNPGAPRQTRKSDKGSRYAALLDTESWKLEKLTLPITFRDYKTVHISVADSQEEINSKILSAVRSVIDNSHAEIELNVQGSILYSKYSLSEKLEQWKNYLYNNNIDHSRVHWKLDQIVQVSSQIMYSSFTRLLVDHLMESAPQEVEDLAPFLFERLQRQNSHILE